MSGGGAVVTNMSAHHLRTSASHVYSSIGRVTPGLTPGAIILTIIVTIILTGALLRKV